jgi:hypothetical protein
MLDVEQSGAHPASTICMRVKGNSMSPLILDDYIIAVDTSEVRHASGEQSAPYCLNSGVNTRELSGKDSIAGSRSA